MIKVEFISNNTIYGLLIIACLLLVSCEPTLPPKDCSLNCNSTKSPGFLVDINSPSFNPSPGYVLFSSKNSKKTYLIDKLTGDVCNYWEGEYEPGMSVYLLENGNLVRSQNITPNLCGYPGGGIAIYDWNNTLLWNYIIDTMPNQQCHDIYPISSDTILAAVWEHRSQEEVIKLGRDTNYENGLWGAGIWKVVYNSTTKEVSVPWKWSIWDHIDTTGTDSLTLDINYTGTPNGSFEDWIHMNAVTYNAELKQIMWSSRNLNEIYIIDASTTTAEAATDTGGIYGKGGDFLYRWGNPQAYGNGTAADQQLFGQHSPYWIPTNFSGGYGGQIMINNDGFGRPISSSNCAPSCFNIIDTTCCPHYNNGPTYVNIINPNETNGVYSYDPNATTVSLSIEVPDSFDNVFRGNAQLLENGNILIDAPSSYDDTKGYPKPSYILPPTFYEINLNSSTNNPTYNIVWQYQQKSESGGSFRSYNYSTSYVNSIIDQLCTDAK